MQTEQQKWLIEYLVNHNFVIDNHEEILRHISGMTSKQILDAMEAAKSLQTQLGSTGLGKELL